jgi:predicted nuclease of predicted toxin-antitoxin system
MLSLLADENFNGDVVRGLLLRRPGLDIVRIQDIGLSGAEDPDVLAWAAENGRILLTHDRATMPDFAYERVRAGLPMSGVFVVNSRHPVGQMIDELLLIDECSQQEEWGGQGAVPSVVTSRMLCRIRGSNRILRN